MDTLHVVGEIADDADTIRALFKLLSASRHDSDTIASAHRALHRVCRRARVRLLPDGTIDSINT